VTKQLSSSTPPISTYYAEADFRWPSRHCVHSAREVRRGAVAGPSRRGRCIRDSVVTADTNSGAEYEWGTAPGISS
jgi:hypothetical protein